MGAFELAPKLDVLSLSLFIYDYIPECIMDREGILGRRQGHVNFIKIIFRGCN